MNFNVEIKHIHLVHEGGTKEYFATTLYVSRGSTKPVRDSSVAFLEWGATGKGRQLKIQTGSQSSCDLVVSEKIRDKLKRGYGFSDKIGKHGRNGQAEWDVDNLVDLAKLIRHISPHNFNEVYAAVCERIDADGDDFLGSGEVIPAESKEAFEARKTEEYGGDWGGWS